MKQLLNWNEVWSAQYVMKNCMKKTLLDIIIDVKCLKGKRDKKGYENLGFLLCLGSTGLHERLVQFTEEGLRLNHFTV